MDDVNKVLTKEEYLAILEKLKKDVKGPLSYCMHGACAELPIYSHVFQKNGPLASIATNGKVMMFSYNTFFNAMHNEPLIEYKPTGINKTFGFYGFCSRHDNSLFEAIEPSTGLVDWYSQQNQYLLGYRTICRECYTLWQVIVYYKRCLDTLVFPQEVEFRYKSIISFAKASLDLLIQYKILFEKALWGDSDFSHYIFKPIRLKFRLDLCLATPVVITEEARTYYGPDDGKIHGTVNLVEIFPDGDETMIIMGFLAGAANRWASEIYSLLASGDGENISYAIQDILFRSEFHCVSKKLYEEIEPEIPKFLDEWNTLRGDFSYKLNYESNILREVIKRTLNLS